MGYSAQQVLNRGFYAVQDTKSPVTINVCVLLFNIILSMILVKTMEHRGLALAYSLSGLLSMVVLGLGLRKKIGSFGGKALLKSAMQSIVASAVMGVFVYFTAIGLEQILDVSSKVMQIVQVFGQRRCGCGSIYYHGNCNEDGGSAASIENHKKKAASVTVCA